MLSKLIKYDLKNKYKNIIVFYILSIFFAILTRIFTIIDNTVMLHIIKSILSGTTIAMIANIIINNIIKLLVVFKTNLYGDESYLTHTLPIKKSTIYLAKFISTFITLFISTIVITLTLFIAYYSKDNIELIKGLLLPLSTLLNSKVILIIIAFILIVFLELFTMIQCGYTGIIIGHRFNNNKVIYSFVFGFIVYVCIQILLILSLLICGIFNNDILNLFMTSEITNYNILKTVMYIAVIFYIIIITIYYFINSKLFNKGVDVL